MEETTCQRCGEIVEGAAVEATGLKWSGEHLRLVFCGEPCREAFARGVKGLATAFYMEIQPHELAAVAA